MRNGADMGTSLRIVDYLTQVATYASKPESRKYGVGIRGENPYFLLPTPAVSWPEMVDFSDYQLSRSQLGLFM
jgi:hypothetical protein